MKMKVLKVNIIPRITKSFKRKQRTSLKSIVGYIFFFTDKWVEIRAWSILPFPGSEHVDAATFKLIKVWKHLSLVSSHTCRRVYYMHAQPNNILQQKNKQTPTERPAWKFKACPRLKKNSKEKVSMNWMHYEP